MVDGSSLSIVGDRRQNNELGGGLFFRTGKVSSGSIGTRQPQSSGTELQGTAKPLRISVPNGTLVSVTRVDTEGVTDIMPQAVEPYL